MKIPTLYWMGVALSLVIWGEDFVYMRNAAKFQVFTIPREEAMIIVAQTWDDYIHKGLVEPQPQVSMLDCRERKRGRWESTPAQR